MTSAAAVKPTNTRNSSRSRARGAIVGARSVHENAVRPEVAYTGAPVIWRRTGIITAVAAAYAAACRVMLAPIFNFGHIATASYGGDARAFIWVLAWDNHAVLDRVPSLFDANKLYPLRDALAYGEH